MKKIKIILFILIIILICLISFCGIYIKDKQKLENILPDYILGRDLTASREIKLDVSDKADTVYRDAEGNIVESEGENITKEEIKVNSEDKLTLENYKTCKEAIEKRLKTMEVYDYSVKLDSNSGKIMLYITEDKLTDEVTAVLANQGKFEIIDAETQELLFDNSSVEKANVLYGYDASNNFGIYLNIQFNEENIDKFTNVTKTYIKIENNTEQSTEKSSETEEPAVDESTNDKSQEEPAKKITLKLDGQELLSTYFGQTITNGQLQLSIGQDNSTEEKVQENFLKANSMAMLIGNEPMPLVYELSENHYILSNITQEQLTIIVCSIIIIVVAAILFLIVVYKENGIIAGASLIGVMALVLIVIRYTNVTITTSGLISIAFIAILNYICLINMIHSIEKAETVKTFINEKNIKNIFLLAPIFIFSIILCFINWTPISSFGMVAFWGISISVVWHLLITEQLVVLFNKK